MGVELHTMPQAFPGLIEWNSSYSVGIPSIDAQHQVLVSIIRQLQEGMLENRASAVVAPLIEAMRQYTKFHFEYEESLLREHEYPALDAHCHLHVELVNTLQDFAEKYETGRLNAGAPLMQFLRRWLLDHIGAHDQQYAPFLREKGVA
jgi:hemerythrin-like metal-binding protein